MTNIADIKSAAWYLAGVSSFGWMSAIFLICFPNASGNWIPAFLAIIVAASIFCVRQSLAQKTYDYATKLQLSLAAIPLWFTANFLFMIIGVYLFAMADAR